MNRGFAGGETIFRREAPGATRLLTVYLAHGYGDAIRLPNFRARAGLRCSASVRRVAAGTVVPRGLERPGAVTVEAVDLAGRPDPWISPWRSPEVG